MIEYNIQSFHQIFRFTKIKYLNSLKNIIITFLSFPETTFPFAESYPPNLPDLQFP
jgi:hypothetical protein